MLSEISSFNDVETVSKYEGKILDALKKIMKTKELEYTFLEIYENYKGKVISYEDIDVVEINVGIYSIRVGLVSLHLKILIKKL